MESPNESTRVVPILKRDTSNEPETPEPEHILTKTSRRRHATVYDAVAGKVSYEQGPGTEPEEPQYTPRHPKAIRYSTKDTPLAPDEVLFRRKDAPERYLENDIYYAHERRLPRGGQGVLPESDLLKAIHGYASAFYGAKDGSRNGGPDERSMDETALIAFGILLEEAGREVLGRRGDLVFTEGQDDDGEETARQDARIVGHDDVELRRGPKRRKVDADDE
ncbi:uncharacterized protein NECHADRAFT_80425 [Fusarium vanettenii 77-13-4]|uniref:Uncharacterized protein n=1 Tax=Fusarium vanettenii (strain ATCC MYA-4622 / CBS 123669 / FGSC 9596 / NRRL 45880 / 77-13-4) TaxID=660122 RepID=C7YRK6_FUSV7|nr:uncharacterized protein NECHADRAFT_80425 [Fusarium vanettenii 77-13-4]EEU45476.1 hypothetical protein NECHADRAFT_80425 [Fusarium vanettenii 77-13-4]